MNQVKIYTSSWCPYCSKAKQILESNGIEYIEINIEKDEKERLKIFEITKQTSVPQIFAGEKYIGNCNKIEEMSKNGTLKKAMKEQ